MLEMLPTARDIAIVVMAVEGIVVLLVPLLLLWNGAKAMRRARPQAALWLRVTNQRVARAARVTNGVLLGIRRPFVWFASTYASTAAGLKRIARVLHREVSREA